MFVIFDNNNYNAIEKQEKENVCLILLVLLILSCNVEFEIKDNLI